MVWGPVARCGGRTKGFRENWQFRRRIRLNPRRQGIPAGVTLIVEGGYHGKSPRPAQARLWRVAPQGNYCGKVSFWFELTYNLHRPPFGFPLFPKHCSAARLSRAKAQPQRLRRHFCTNFRLHDSIWLLTKSPNPTQPFPGRDEARPSRFFREKQEFIRKIQPYSEQRGIPSPLSRGDRGVCKKAQSAPTSQFPL